MTEVRLIGLPDRYRAANLSNYFTSTPEQETAMRGIKYWGKNALDGRHGDGLILTGLPGTGKTHVLASIGNIFTHSLLGSGRVDLPIYATAASIYEDILEAATNSRGRKARLRKYTSASLLLIDEFGVGTNTDFARDVLSQIIDSRYSSLKPTAIASNLTVSEMAAYIDERIIDRLTDGRFATILAFTWPSYRGQGKQTTPGNHEQNEQH